MWNHGQVVLDIMGRKKEGFWAHKAYAKYAAQKRNGIFNGKRTGVLMESAGDR